MDNTELRKLLQELHKEIEKTQAVDEKGTRLLRNLEKDITALLDRSEENLTKSDLSDVHDLEDTLEHFEVTHPTLTTQISRLLEFLSNSGI